MTDSRHANDDSDNFDLDWEALTFSSTRTSGADSGSMDDWEQRFNQDTTGYVPNPSTTSFTDLDLGPARADLQRSAEWADLDSWSGA
jgi:hypothetical protein